MIKAAWRAESGFFLGIWLFFMVGGRSRLFRDPGTFWHTVVGRRILASGYFFEAGRFGLSRLAWLIPIFWVWSNMHGGALAGLAMMILAVAGWCVLRLLGLESPIEHLRQVAVLVLIIATCGLAFVVNPYGVRL